MGYVIQGRLQFEDVERPLHMQQVVRPSKGGGSNGRGGHGMIWLRGRGVGGGG